MRNARQGIALAAILLALNACESQDPTEPTESEPPATKTTAATLTSLDGQTTGHIEVTLSGSVATIEFIDLETPYARVGLGGSSAPRGDDPCFDTGPMAKGGDLRPPDNLNPGPFPGYLDGAPIQEIDLHVNAKYAQEDCFNTSVARAVLEWSE